MKSSRAGRADQWACLYHDILSEITNRLTSRLDIQRARGVCHSWRHSISPPLKSNIYTSLKLPFPIISDEPDREGPCYTITEQSVFCIEPINNKNNEGWFVKLRVKDDGKVTIIDPLLRNEFLPRVLSLLDYRVREVKTVYGLELDLSIFTLHGTLKDVVICDDDEHGLAVITATGLDDLIVWRKGDIKWNLLESVQDTGQRFICKEVVYHNKKVYAVHTNGMLVVVNPFELTLVTVVAAAIGPAAYVYPSFYKAKYHLVSSCGDLYLVIKTFGLKHYHPNCSVWMVFFKFEEEKGCWVCVNSLGDNVFIIGYRESFSVSALDCPRCKVNCIYFYDGIKITYDSIIQNPGFYDLNECKGSSNIFLPPLSLIKSPGITRKMMLFDEYLESKIYWLDKTLGLEN